MIELLVRLSDTGGIPVLQDLMVIDQNHILPQQNLSGLCAYMYSIEGLLGLPKHSRQSLMHLHVDRHRVRTHFRKQISRTFPRLFQHSD